MTTCQKANLHTSIVSHDVYLHLDTSGRDNRMLVCHLLGVAGKPGPSPIREVCTFRKKTRDIEIMVGIGIDG